MQNILTVLTGYLGKISLPGLGVIDIIEIGLISFFVYQFMAWIKFTRAYTLLKGILVVLGFILIAYIFKMNTILWIFRNLANVLVIGVIVIFQPELRRALEQLGQKKIVSTIIPFDSGKEVKERFNDKTINELVKACFDMGEVKTGALIVIEEEIRLDEYIRTGINIDGILTSQLLINIFEHNTPLHDGAVIVRGNRVVAATCYLPLSDNMELSKQLGTRHRAGVGISEATDSVTIIVSEETGQVSVAQGGELSRGLNSKQLREILVAAQNKKVVDNSKLRNLLKGRVNIPLKIMSVIVGILVWLIVVNVDDPIITKGFVISDVQIINEAYVDQLGQMVMQDDSENTVRVYITGERKTVNRLTSSDIKAVADLQQAQSTDTDPVMIPITATCAGVLPENIRVSPQNLSVHLEKKVTKEFAINVSCGDSKPAQGLEIASLTANPEKVRVTGPESLVGKIDSVSVDVSSKIDGIDQDTTITGAELTITDKNQDTLSSNSMSYLKFDNNGKVNVTAKLWKVRSDIRISAGYTGEPAEGYVVDSVTTVPETFSVAGSEEALNSLKLQGNTIYLDNENVDISGKSNDVEKKVNLAELLPDGLKLTTGSSTDLWITVNILPEGSKIYNFPTEDIKVKGLPDNLQLAFEVADVELKVQAEDGDLSGFNLKSISATLSMDDWEEGSYEVPIKISLPDGYKLLEDVTAEIKISKVSNVDSGNSQ